MTIKELKELVSEMETKIRSLEIDSENMKGDIESLMNNAAKN